MLTCDFGAFLVIPRRLILPIYKINELLAWLISAPIRHRCELRATETLGAAAADCGNSAEAFKTITERRRRPWKFGQNFVSHGLEGLGIRSGDEIDERRFDVDIARRWRLVIALRKRSRARQQQQRRRKRRPIEAADGEMLRAATDGRTDGRRRRIKPSKQRRRVIRFTSRQDAIALFPPTASLSIATSLCSYLTP